MLIAGRYRLLEPIGRGAMGEVWRGHDEMLGRPVAVKLLLEQASSDATAAARFRLEAQTAGALSHPHVVGVLDFGQHEERLFLVMELVEGSSLARLGRQPADRVARIAAQAAAGLAAAHQQGIVHRDIKPANLLLDADGTLKIGDFGIARFLDDPGAALTATGQIVGTGLYLAPERALGRPAGPPSDVYALGCVLYQLLTGRPPFNADTALGVLHLHLDAAPVPPRDLGVQLPPPFEDFLLDLLAKEPDDRPSAQQIADWFTGGAWQSRAEPLPPSREPAAPVPPPPAPAAVATYRLPAPEQRRRRPSGARGTSGGRGPAGGRRLSRTKKKVVAGLAGVLLFVGALLAGMTWFAPDRSSAETTRPPAATTPGPTDPAATPATVTADEPVPGTQGEDPAKDRKGRKKNGKHDDD
ncbi:serine/threonine protein kinase [Streptomyces sp. Ru71]|uniref:serine/threonine-protein kinase n=1 Tax=Streptomyces sp. Ru71 TaxID=2080746 RepID=UPI000CDDE7E0|nr:serine/threonine-protein kinase [Streptomyces sp. Ru71]POX56743.1 serine/threonine protein kinase [Streptomyces sp. Ru71]